uniref:Aminopeptidase n=1 Tax=Scleropages formosus TaxID=113540 RepID=A0A8C9SCB0_SCLFO
MAKGFYISKAVGIAGIVLAAAAVATIIALSVVYAEEKSKNVVSPTEGGVETRPTTVEPKPTTGEPTSLPPSNEPWNKYRLPDTLIPEYYNMTLWPHLNVNQDGMYIFKGSSSVVFQCLKETDLILIHAKKLNFTEFDGHQANLTGVDGSKPPTIKSTWLQEETQYLVILLNDNLAPGKYQLDTDFQGELADDLGGFYRSEYYEDGVKKVVATTQMQATDARKAFPCFDEPAMKAVFHITLIHERGTVALSNGKEISTENITMGDLSLSRTTFEPTKTMSTYLLAFIVCDYLSIEAQAENVSVMIRIWARKKAIEEGQGEYALNVTGPILKFFEDYYNSSYPLSKSDQIALPDFNAGAMENWGLITYRETALLYDSAVSSNSNKERIVTVIAHELAHMWFGNLVTLRWWNDLWLNEGFASYVEYLGADFAEPEWNIKDLIVLSDMHRVFAVDALASSHPLSSKEDEINRPAQISEVFDTISYSKGASVLRMLSEFLSEPIFTSGLSTYLNHFAYNNTVYTQLWDHLQSVIVRHGLALPHTVHDIMNRWVLQMGFPVVTIDTSTGTVSQKHFLLDPDSVVDRPSDFNYEWFVPIKWMKSGTEQQESWLLQKTGKKTGWVLANLNVTGYYRVNYDLSNWERLLTLLDSTPGVIPVINRAQLVEDAFNLARAKIIDTTLALRTTKYLSKEREYMPWQTAINNLDYFFLMFDRTEVYGPMQVSFFEHNDCYYTNTAANVKRNRIHPNLRSTVYCSAIAEGGVEEWDFGWKMFESASIAAEAEKIRTALTCTKQPWLLNRFLEYTLDPNKIRKQDATSTIINIASNVVGQSLAWDFVRARWDHLFNQYGGGSFSFSNLINGVTKRFSTEFELKQLQQFKQDNGNFGSGELAVEQSIERTAANIKWVAENKEKVLQWFSNKISDE